MKVRNGEVIDVHNSSRKFGSSLWYRFVRVRDLVTGAQIDLLFTSDELDTAASRALRNPEDLPGRSFAPTWLQWFALIAAIVGVMFVSQCSLMGQPAPLPAAGVLNFNDNYGGDDTKVVFWWRDGWLPPRWDIVGTRDVDPNTDNYCLLTPVFYRYIFGYTNGVYSVAPSKAVVIDMANTTDNPCDRGLLWFYTPQVWHVKLIPSP